MLSFFVQRTVPNTNPELYLSNEKSKWCVLCDRKYVRIVSHYKTVHIKSEVYASRLSSHMVDVLRRRSASINRFNRSSTLYLETTCPFCECKKAFTTQYWVLHIRSHTGEYSNECEMCNKLVCFNTHCGYTTIQSEKIDLRQSDLKAYVCLICNFVQIDMEKVHTHLTNQHGVDEIDNLYEKVILLPSWKAQPAQSTGKCANQSGQLNIAS